MARGLVPVRKILAGGGRHFRVLRYPVLEAILPASAWAENVQDPIQQRGEKDNDYF